MVAQHGTTAPLRQAIRQHRTLPFLTLALSATCALLVLLSGCGASATGTSAVTPPAPQTLFARQVHVTPAPPISTVMRAAKRNLYLFSLSNVGLMLPAVDAHGNVWAGEMNANRLGRLSTQTGLISSWSPPGAEHGIMATVIDSHGDVWFAEQNANYIGRFDPRQQAFHLFPLGVWNGKPLGPQDLQFDGAGLLWFTAEAGGVLGRLDPATGAIRVWPVPSTTPGVLPYPSGLTVAAGGQVWFGEMADGAIGSLDPASGQFTLYRLPAPQAEVFALALDSAGRLWFTEVSPGKLGMLDPASGTLTELPVPALSGGPPALYALAIDHRGNIWFVDVGANTLVRYVPAARTMTFFQLSLRSSAPFGLALDPSGRLWFTAGGPSANYIGEMSS